LIVVDASGSVVERQMHVTRLGQGVDASRQLDPAAVQRTVDVLQRYRQVMDGHGVVDVRVVATSAVRDATNAAEFVEAVRSCTGVVPEILPGQEEGRLSFLGATAHLPEWWDRRAPTLVVDIGGGSTELSVGPPGSVAEGDDEPVTVSLDIGCVRSTERLLRADPPTSPQLRHARQEIGAELRRARRQLPALGDNRWMVGLAGTVATVAMLVGGVEQYERRLVHHVAISRTDVEDWLDRLAGEDAATRRSEPGMVDGRQDVIVAGVLVLAETMAVFDRDHCLASEDDILDGLAASLRHRPNGPISG